MKFYPGRLSRFQHTVVYTVFLGFLLCTLNTLRADDGLTPVTLQLQWNHQFQFAGYYAALHKGYYRDAGLDVSIKDGGYDESGYAVNPEEEVLFNRAQFGITRTDLLIHHSEGLPLVVLANIMQHSPYIFLTIEDYGFKRLEEIGTKRPITLNINAGENRIDAEAVAALKVAGVKLESLNNSFPTWNLADLIEGKTQLIPAYSTDEPYFIRQAGRVPVAIEPRNYGIDFYGDLLFTSQNMLSKQPEIVQNFRQASLKGWKYAMQNPGEIVNLIVKNYTLRNADYDKEFLLFEARQMQSLMSPDVIEIGYINRDRWNKIAEIYQSLGLVNDFDLDKFLYKVEPEIFLSLYKNWILGISFLFLLTLVIIFYFYLLTNRLRNEIRKRHEVEGQLIKQAYLDALTGIDNRYLFESNLEREFDRARRYKHQLSVLMIDIDDFKDINDEFGHLAGDELLKSFVQVSQQLLRQTDFFARYGGDEFVVLLPSTALDHAIILANRILQENLRNRIEFERKEIKYNLSIGVAELKQDDKEPHELLKRSDEMLYAAKGTGKNRVTG